MTNAQRIRVECRDCSFSRVIDQAADDVLPADVLRRHGRKTGHTLDIAHLGEGER